MTVGSLVGCVSNSTNPPTAQQPPVVNANTAVPVNSNPPPAPSSNSSAAVTLPLVDALLSDENYVKDVKSTVGLSDDEIKKLQDAAREATSELDETGDQTRSTTAASKNAERQIKSILGEDKGSRFLAYVRDHASEADALALANAKPNAVPTDTRIVVNIPEYRMDVFENGRLKKTYAVGIGYPEFPLPVGLRKAEKIILNPTWTPPDEPWVKGKFKPGKKVEAGSKDNPLGPIKIPIGLPNLIHGGKSPSRIGNFASHGCVGLTNAGIKDFAQELSALSGSPLNATQLNERLAEKSETKEVKLGQPVSVELRYETIVIEDGKLHIFRDVYERGTNTEDNLRRVFDAQGLSIDNLNPADREKILAGLQQMAIDAGGQPVDPSTAPDSNQNTKEMKKANPTGKVTKNIKGQKEVVFELAELKGKGYPAPVNLVRQ